MFKSNSNLDYCLYPNINPNHDFNQLPNVEPKPSPNLKLNMNLNLMPNMNPILKHNFILILFYSQINLSPNLGIKVNPYLLIST